MDYAKKALQQHKKLGGKIALSLKDKLDTQEKLSIYYTPGVAEVSRYTAAHPSETRDYTWTHNCVAIISDGSAVLGLGNIGPQGALPVMEGKAMLFKHFANIDAVPIVLDVHKPDEIVAAVTAIAPSFGGINLEDIAAPTCFEVEERLKHALSIPVMHDDQHGTAVVVLAGLINATKVVKKSLASCRIVLIGAGAAGVAIAKLLHKYANPDIIAIDSKGVIDATRDTLTNEKRLLASYCKPPPDHLMPRTLHEALHEADIVIGVSQPGMLKKADISVMSKKPIIFALSNPTPEIMPDEAKAAGAAIVATGRSDFDNQVNNALAFPGIFRGALDHQVSSITDQHKIKAAEAIAKLVAKPSPQQIIPHVFDDRLIPAIARVIT